MQVQVYGWVLLKNTTENIQNRTTSDSVSKNCTEMLKNCERLYTDLKEMITQYLEEKVKEDMLISLQNNFLLTSRQTDD